MFVKTIVSYVFRAIKRIDTWSAEPQETSIYAETQRAEEHTIFSVWDALRFKENTQAYHLNSVIGFEEWVDMEEIRRRIRELFGAEYKNFRSLYPYLKTLSDIGLMETTSAGGRRKWRKVALFVPAKKEAQKEEGIKAEIKKESNKKN